MECLRHMDGVLVQSISEVLIRILIGQANLHAHMTPPPIFKHSTPPIKCSVMAQESHFALLSHYLSLYCINKGLSFPRQECLKNKTWQKIQYVWQVHAQNQAKWREIGRDKSVNHQSKLLPLGCSKQVYLWQQKSLLTHFPNTAAGS